MTASNERGEGPRSGEAKATPMRKPMMPLNLTATGGEAEASLTWSPPASDGGSSITNYTVFRGTSSGNKTSLIKLGNVLEYTDAPLVNGQTYHYGVVAENAAGEGPMSGDAMAKPFTIPSAPSGLTAAISDRRVILNWTPPAWDGGSPVTNYSVYRGATSGSETLIATVGNTLTFTDGGLNNGVRYYYEVSARNVRGAGPRSNETSAIPAAVPGAPTTLAATPGGGQLVLTWSPPTDSGGFPILNYSIYRGTGSHGEMFLIKIGNVQAFTDTGLTNGRPHYYVVSASNMLGEGARSEEVAATPATTPSAPLNLRALAGNGQVTLSWALPMTDGGAAITNYTVHRGETSGSEVPIGSVGIAYAFNDTALRNEQRYYYRVSARNAMGEGNLSGEADAMPTGTPSAPLNIQATAGYRQITLSWTAPASDGGSVIEGYRIYRGNSSGGESLLNIVGNVTTYVDWGLVRGQQYYYEITARNARGEGPPSVEINGTPIGKPGPPIGLTATAGNAQVTLAWSPPSDDGGSAVMNYRIYRSFSSLGETLLTTLGNVTGYSDAGLGNGRTYFYTVSAVNVVGEGPPSSETFAALPTTPSEPLYLSAVAGDGHVALTWNHPLTDGGSVVTNHTVYRGTTSNGETALAIIGNESTFTDSGLINGRRYYYRVSASNAIGEGTLSVEASATPVATPSAPLSLQATAGNRRVTLAWSAPTASGGSPITGYRIFRGTSSGGEVQVDVVGNVTVHLDYGLASGQTYFYKISAKNNVGEGPQSAEASATPFALPGPPIGLGAAAGSGHVALSWSPPADIGGSPITNYKVYRSASSGGEVLAATVGNVTGYSDTNVESGKTYYYKVSAVNVAGEGPQSSEISATPGGLSLPSAPRNLLAIPGNAKARLTWDPPASNGGSAVARYVIYRGTMSGGETNLTMIGGVLEYQDTGLTNGVTYFYQVSAVNAVGEGPRSLEVSAAPRVILPECFIWNPVNGSTVSGTYTVAGTSATRDLDRQIQTVEVSIDGGPWNPVTGLQPWRFDWDTSKVSDGRHTISARSYDGTDYSAATTVEVIVNNEAAQTQTESTIFKEPLFWASLVALMAAAMIIILFLLDRRYRKKEEERRAQEAQKTVEETLNELLSGEVEDEKSRST